MRLVPEVKAKLAELLPLILEMPDGQYLDLNWDGASVAIHLQCQTQAEVKAARAMFPGAIWRKSYSGGAMNWWEYNGDWSGTRIKIYACQEAPPTCRMVSREVEVEEQVPIEYETRMVTKTVVEWECGEGAEA
jgi:hypothetical protein